MFFGFVHVGACVLYGHFIVFDSCGCKQSRHAESVGRFAAIRQQKESVVCVPFARQGLFALVQVTVWCADDNMPVRFADAYPITDSGHWVVDVFKDVAAIHIVKCIVCVDVHCGSVAHILIVVYTILGADSVCPVVGVNATAADVYAVAFDVLLIKAFIYSALMRLACLCHSLYSLI